MKHKITHALHQVENLIFAAPKAILGAILLITVFFALQIPGLKIFSEFADLLPLFDAFFRPAVQPAG